MKTNNQKIFFELKQLLKNSQATFSNFKAAAIIKTDKGIFKGVNYEDNVLNLGICAERNAVFNGITNGIKKIYEVHLLTSNKLGTTLPCGACRQVLSNFMTKNSNLFVYDVKGNFKVYKINDILPFNKIF